MEETQAIDFDDLPAEEEPLQLDIHQVAGELQTVSVPSDRLPLYLGLNVVGRGSSQADQEVMLNKWKADFSGMLVHDLESAGAVCWIKDTGSRNKTLLGRAGGLTVLQSKGDRYSVLPGDKLKFGAVDTIITYSTTYHQADTAGGAQPGSDHGYSSHATQGQRHVSRSPTPDMAAAQPIIPSAPAAATDNDMTLPWDDPLDEPHLLTKNSPGNAADNTDAEVHEPPHAAEQALTEAPILPDTQANDLPDDTGARFRELSTGPQDLAFAEPTQLADAPTHLMGEPTQLIGESTQLAEPARPVAAAPNGQPGSQAGTALASAAAQAMTGAHPSQASVLPSSGGFPTAMPSLADPPPAPAPSPAGSALAQNSGPAQDMSKSLPISGPEADAVLHLPSQPSGSQHAAHPHGPPRTQGAGSAAVAAPKPSEGSDMQNQHAGTGEQSHHGQTQQDLGASQGVQDSAAAGAAAGSSDQNTLLDSVLGHDDDDSIWMPPASLPDSEGPYEGGLKPASLPSKGGQNMPLQLQAPTAGAAEGSAPAAVPIPQAAQQASDSDQTQDSQEDADADGISAPPAATTGPNHQGNAGPALPHAEEGMYTGAFAFPDSASLEVSQPAVDLPYKPGKGQPVTAAQPAARGKAAKAAAAAKAGKEPAVQGRATAAEAGKTSASAVRDDRAGVAKDVSSAGAGAGAGGGSPKGRVMPSGWKKKKKADPAADGHAESAAEEATEAAGPSAEPPAGALQDQVHHDAAQKEEAAPSSTHVAHGTGKPTPWRVRGTPLGVGPAAGSSQLPNSEDINAAMAAAGDLAAFFPSTQAEQEVVTSVAAHTTVDPNSTGTAAAAPTSKSMAAAAVAEESNPAAASTDEDGVQGVSHHAVLPQQPGAFTAAEHGLDPKAASQSGHTSAEAEHQQVTAAAADSRSADKASHAQPDEAEDVQSHSQRQASRRKQASTAAVDEEEDRGSAGGRGRGRGSRGKVRGQARGRKRSSPDAETEEGTARVGKSQAKAAKGKRGRSKGREASPALQPTRVSKRQKAKAEAQAADAAQQEEEEDHNPEDDTFFGAATQAAAGILEDLRRSATPDEDADMDAAEAAPPVPALQPSMKGRRSTTTKRTARAASAAAAEPAVTAAEAPAQDHAVPDSQSSGKSTRPKRRALAQSKAAAASGGNDPLPGHEDSAEGTGAAASTAAQSNGHDSTAAGGASEGQEEGSVPVKRGQKRQAGADSTDQGRRKSRLSKASSPAPDPSPIADDPPETLAKQPGPARRETTAKQPRADKQKKSNDTDSSAPKRKSGTGSTAVKSQGAAGHETVPEQAEEAAGSVSGRGSMEEPSGGRAAGSSKASSSRGKANRKSALTRVNDDEHPPAASGGGRRGSAGGQPGSKQGAAASTAPGAPAGNAVGSKAKQGPRAKQVAARRHSQATSAAATEKEAQPSAASGGKRRGPQAKASTARAASQSPEAAAEAEGQEEEGNEDESEAGPSVRQPGGNSAAAEKGAQAKGKTVRGKRSRQPMEEDAAADVGSAGHVKAARKATDSKPVRVLYSTALDKAKKSSMTKVIRRLGGSVEDAEGPDFTHFVALQPTAANQTDRGFKKSINALIALAAGRPIVSETWGEACNRSSSFVDPVDHLLIDKAAQKKYGFDLRTSYERAQHQLLLAGLHIFFTPGALAGESDGGTNIKNLVGHAGGVVEKELPKSASSKDAGVWSQWLLIGSENDKNKDQKLCRKQYAAGLTFHGRSMLIDSIMQQSLDRKHGVLFTT